MTPQARGPINPEHLRNQIKLHEAKAKLKHIRWNAFRRHSEHQRKWIEDLSKAAGMARPRAFIEAMYEQSSAEAGLMEIDLRETESLVAILKEQLQEAENQIILQKSIF